MKTKSFLGWCVLFLISITFFSNVKAQQQIPYISSYDSIVVGMACSDTGNYSRASTLFECVSPYDTNYSLALLEDALTKESAEDNSAALKICQVGLAQESDYTPDFYNIEANVYMNDGDYEDAVKLMQDTVLPKYTNLYSLYFTTGLAQYKMHKYGDAIISFQKAIDLNLYDPVSHYYLGRCCLEQGRLIPALLSLQFYLVIQSQGNRSLTTIGLIEQMTSNKYQYNKLFAVDPATYHDSAFTELDLLIRSKIAMNKEYKATTKIHYNFEKQVQLFFEQLKYVPNTGNYWMEKYVPFFTGIRQKKFLTPYLYFITSSVSDAELQKDIAKNGRKIKKFAKWADAFLDAQRARKEIELDGKKVTVTCNYFDNNRIESMGQVNSAGKRTGEWTFYYGHSCAVYSHGKYNDKGEREVKWQWFFNTGALKETANYSNGKREGTEEIWYENGAPKAKYSFHNDLFEGDCFEYNISGILTTRAVYKEDNIVGEATYYYDDGKQHFSANYIAGKFEGELKEFYPGGQVKTIKTMKNNLKNGPYTTYCPNGKTHEAGFYTDGNQSGHWKVFYKDGSLQKEGDFNDKGLPIIKWVFYYRNGKKAESEPYNKNGEIDGTDTIFDKDGIEYKELLYKNGIMQSYVYKDKSGNIISSGKLDGKILSMISYNPEGGKNHEGYYENNMAEGTWKFYNEFGDLSGTETYADDNLDGIKIDYFSDGKVQDSINYLDNDKNGYSVTFHPNGNMKSQGWYVYGYKQGDWYTYDLKGHVAQHCFYVNGGISGKVQYFESNGILSEEHYFKHGYLDKIFSFDTTGTKPVYRYISDKGNGKFLLPYYNGNTVHELNYVNGTLDGPEKRYYSDGKLAKEGEYLLGSYEGTVKGYFENGNVKFMYNYEQGSCEGAGSSYYPNGNLEQTSNYYEDELDGERRFYYENGKLDIVSHYSEGDHEGEYVSYFGDSIVTGIFWFHKGNIIAYSSADKTGKPVKRIPLDKSSGSVICYYPSGNKSVECTYEKGSIIGTHTSYAPNGKIFSEENFEKGYRSGPQKYYFEGDTTLKEVDNYYYGELDGVCRYYYKNGVLEHEETYSLGTREGPFRYYDKNGQLIKIVYYFDGYAVGEKVANK